MKYSRDYISAIEIDVKNYECDMWKIVAHPIYFHYFERARTKYAKEIFNLNMNNLAQQHNNGFVIASANMNFKQPLMPEHVFTIETKMLRLSTQDFMFFQNVFLNQNGEEFNGNRFRPVTSAEIKLTSINLKTGKAEVSKELEEILRDVTIADI